MSTVLTVLNHVFSLDLTWLLQFVLDNVLWLFLFGAAAAIFYEGKSWFWSFVYIVFYVWVATEFAGLVGWQILSAEFLAFNLIAAIAALTFAEFDPWGSKNLLLVNSLRFLAALAIFNLFMGG